MHFVYYVSNKGFLRLEQRFPKGQKKLFFEMEVIKNQFDYTYNDSNTDTSSDHLDELAFS